MIEALLSGCLCGLGVVLAVLSLRVRHVPLSELVGRVANNAFENKMVRGTNGDGLVRTSSKSVIGKEYHKIRNLAGSLFADQIARRPSLYDSLSQDLSITESSLIQLSCDMAVSSVGLGIIVPLILVIASAFSFTIPFSVPIFAALLMIPLGAIIPVMELKKNASQERERFQYILGVYLELVSLGMAGAMGIESSLDGAAKVSDDKVFRRINQQLNTARMKAYGPWEGLSNLGTEIGVGELGELAANVQLAGSEGAKIRSSLRSKSSTIRKRVMALEEAKANSITEKMFLPGVILLAGFMLFVGYPAMIHVFKGV